MKPTQENDLGAETRMPPLSCLPKACMALWVFPFGEGVCRRGVQS